MNEGRCIVEIQLGNKEFILIAGSIYTKSYSHTALHWSKLKVNQHLKADDIQTENESDKRDRLVHMVEMR